MKIIWGLHKGAHCVYIISIPAPSNSFPVPSLPPSFPPKLMTFIDVPVQRRWWIMEAYQCCPDLHVFRADHFRLGSPPWGKETVSPLLGGHSVALHQGVKPCSISLLHIGLSTVVVLAGLMRASGLFRVHGSSLSVLSRKYDYITVTPVLSFTHHLSLTPPPLCRPSYLSFFFFPSFSPSLPPFYPSSFPPSFPPPQLRPPAVFPSSFVVLCPVSPSLWLPPLVVPFLFPGFHDCSAPRMQSQGSQSTENMWCLSLWVRVTSSV